LTESYTWRWVFYINLPIGALAFLGITSFLPETARDIGAKLDWLGFGTLSLGIGALQVLLDRGEQLDWFAPAKSSSRRSSPLQPSTCSSSTPSPPTILL